MGLRLGLPEFDDEAPRERVEVGVLGVPVGVTDCVEVPVEEVVGVPEPVTLPLCVAVLDGVGVGLRRLEGVLEGEERKESEGVGEAEGVTEEEAVVVRVGVVVKVGVGVPEFVGVGEPVGLLLGVAVCEGVREVEVDPESDPELLGEAPEEREPVGV